MTIYDTVILGGGVTGCTAAKILAERGEKVCIVDSYPTLGGNHKSWTYGDISFDIGSIFFWTGGDFFTAFPTAAAQCVPSPYTTQRIAPSRRVLKYPFDTREEFFRKPLSYKVQVFLDILISRLRYARPTSALDFIQGRIGHRLTADSGLLNHIRRLFGLEARDISVVLAERRMGWVRDASRLGSLWARLRKRPPVTDPRQEARRCVARPRAGFGVMYAAVAQELRDCGVDALLACTDLRLEQQEGLFVLQAGGQQLSARNVLSTMPLTTTAALAGIEIEAPRSTTLYSLFCKSRGERGFASTVLYNFTDRAMWKRLTVHSDYYGRAPEGHEYFCIEIPSDHGDLDAETIMEDFRSSCRDFGIFQGELIFVDVVKTDFAYPVLSPASIAASEAAIDRLEMMGIRMAGRQGRFDYIPSADSAVKKIYGAMM